MVSKNKKNKKIILKKIYSCYSNIFEKKWSYLMLNW